MTSSNVVDVTINNRQVPVAVVEYKCDLSADCYEHAETILGESKEIRDQSLLEIYQWLDDNPKIKGNRDVKSVLHFLRGSKFRMDKTKKKITKFYLMRTQRIEWFLNRDPFRPELVELMDLGVFLPLKIKDQMGRQIVVIRTAAHDPKKHLQNNVFKVGKMILDLLIENDETISIYGIVAIFDMAGVQLGHALQLPPKLVKRTVECWECYPCLIKRLEFVNAPLHVNVVLNTFRLFMSNKLKSRVSVTRGLTNLLTTKISSDILPPELGGTGESYEELIKYWKQYTQEQADWFKYDDQFKSLIEENEQKQ